MHPTVAQILNATQQQSASEVIAQTQLLQTLIAIQNQLGYIPKDSIGAIAGAFNLTRAEVYGVITFYTSLNLQEQAPATKLRLQVCQAEACQAMGSRQLTATLQQKYPPDHSQVSIDKVYCLGNCALAPSIMLNNRCYGKVSVAQIQTLIDNNQTTV